MYTYNLLRNEGISNKPKLLNDARKIIKADLLMFLLQQECLSEPPELYLTRRDIQMMSLCRGGGDTYIGFKSD